MLPAGTMSFAQDVLVRCSTPRSCNPEGRHKDILIAYPDGIVTARKTTSAHLPADVGTSIRDAPILDRSMRATIRRTSWGEVRSFTVSDSVEVGLGSRGQRRFGRVARISLRSGDVITQFLEHRDVARVAMYAKAHLGKRVGKAPGVEPLPDGHSEGRWIYWALGALPFGSAVALAGLVPVGAWIVARAMASPVTSGRRAALVRRVAAALGLAAVPSALGLLGMLGGFEELTGISMGAGATITFIAWLSGIFLVPAAVARLGGLWFGTARRVLDEMPPREPQRPGWFDRLMARLPAAARSRALSLSLRGLSVVLYVGGMILLGVMQAPAVLSSVHAAACATILAIGYRCGARSATELRAADPRPPIVFLRSFRDDGRGTLNPDSLPGQLLGLASLRALRLFGPIANFAPARMLRMLFGGGDDSSEEQLRNWFSRKGPFIAIGRPDEGIPTPGAGRDYVSHGEWKQRVSDWIQRARLVVIQPGQTHGIWWEINRVLELRGRDEVLFSLVALQDRQAEYEDFALRLRERTGVHVPLFAGDAVFMRLGHSTAELVRPVCRPPLGWPIAGCVVDIGRTLDPDDRSRRGFWNSADSTGAVRLGFAAAALLAILAWNVLSLVPAVAMTATANAITEGVKWAEVATYPCGRQRTPVSWAGLRWMGGEALRPAGEGPFAYKRPGVFAIGGVAERCPTDIPPGEAVSRGLAFAAELLGARAGEGPFDGTTHAAREGGLHWHERMLVVPDERNPSASPDAIVLTRATVLEDRLLCTWAMIEGSAGSEALVRSVRAVLATAQPTDWPTEGMGFELVPPEGWQRVDAEAPAVAMLQGEGGRAIAYFVYPQPERLSTTAALGLIKRQFASGERTFRQTTAIEALIDVPGAPSPVPEIVLCLRAERDAGNPQPTAVVVRCILDEGWWFLSVAEGPADSNVEDELLEAARAMKPR